MTNQGDAAGSGDRLRGLDEILSGSVDKPAYLVVRDLLRFCAANRAELNEIHRRPGGADRRKLRNALASVTREQLFSEALDATDIEALKVALRAHAGTHATPLIAQSLAEALDDALGTRFLSSMPDEATVGPADVFFVARPNLKLLFAPGLNGNPDSFEVPPDSTAHLRLLEGRFEYELRVSRKAAQMLRPLGADSRIGFVLPNKGLEEFAVPAEPRDRFFGAAPLNSARQSKLIVSAIDWASANRVAILVLPELGLDEAVLEQLKVRYRNATETSSLPLFVAGSVHVVADGHKRNRCTVLGPGGFVAEHDKLEPFTFKIDGLERTEDIKPGGQITVHVSNESSVVALICKDFLPNAMVQLLVHAAPSAVLVPAMSPKTDVFDTNARHLASHIQAVVAVANTTGEEDQGTVILSRPLRTDPLHTHVRRDTQHPVLIVLYVRTIVTHDRCQTVPLTDG